MNRHTHRGYVFTINNPTPADYMYVHQESECPDIKHYAYQTEIGTNGTKHIQGYFEYDNAVRATRVSKKLDRAHIEPRMGTPSEAYKYCTKPESKTDGPSGASTPEPASGPGSRSDLSSIADAVLRGDTVESIAFEYPSAFIRYGRGIRDLYSATQSHRANSVPTVILCFGPTGVGKSKLCNADPINTYNVNTGTNNNVWFTGYAGQSTIAFDDFYGWLKWDFLLRLTDRYPVRLPIHGGSLPCQANRFIFTSNKRPSTWYKNMDMAPFWRRTTECRKYTGLDVYTLLSKEAMKL